jgi:hypothetical protein
MKLSEYIVANRIETEDQYYDKLPPFIIGYRKGISLFTAQCSIEQRIRSVADNKQFGCLIALDLSQAFDRIEHEVVFESMAELGISVTYINGLKQLYKNREFQCTNYRAGTSNRKRMSRGIPQGAVLSGMMMCMIMHKFPIKELIEVIIFADDILLMTFGTNLSTIESNMQEQLDMVQEFISKKNLKINPEKCQAMAFDPMGNQVPITLHLNAKDIPNVSEMKYLGITWNPPFIFDKHIQNQIANAYGRLALSKRTSGYQKGLRRAREELREELRREKLMTIYTGYIWLILEFGSQLYAHFSKRSIKQFEIMRMRLCA